jgi:hypothetical protein
MEQPAAMFPLCTQIKSDGTRCGSPALKGMNLCFQHIGGNTSALTRARATSGANAKLKFVYPGDREAIQHNLFLVAQALSDGKIDTAMANTYNRIFRTCELNLRRWETAKQNEDKRMFPLPDEAPESEAPESNVQRSQFSDQDTRDRDSTISDRYPEPFALRPEPCPPGAPSLPPAPAMERVGENPLSDQEHRDPRSTNSNLETRDQDSPISDRCALNAELCSVPSAVQPRPLSPEEMLYNAAIPRTTPLRSLPASPHASSPSAAPSRTSRPAPRAPEQTA